MTRVEAIPYDSMAEGLPWNWVTFPEYLDAVDALPKGVNVLPYVPVGPLLTPDALDAHQDALQAALEASGEGWLTTTRLRGTTWLRAGIVNYLATEDDIDHLLDVLRGLGAAR
jgi:hypothetical protein